MRVAVVGGGIAGLAAAYELEKGRKGGKPLDWHLYEASDRLGGTVQTTRHVCPDGEYILEGGPDAWVTEKPWARELAEELGLADQIIPSNDEGKKTYIWIDGQLVAMPDRMRMMVPEDLASLDASPLFSSEAKAAYAREMERAEELKQDAQARSEAGDMDESVASFVRRHFGEEVLEKIGAPLLSGVFGGDVARLSVASVMAAFSSMEREHGSLIVALQQHCRERGARPPQPTFTTLRSGMGTLPASIVAALPPDRVHTQSAATALARAPGGAWMIRFTGMAAHGCAVGFVPFDRVLLAVPVDAARSLLGQVDAEAAEMIPKESSSAVLTTFCWPAETARRFAVPEGFGFLVPQQGSLQADRPKLLAGTFTTQKFAGRAPAGARVVRVFFGGAMAGALQQRTDEAVVVEAWRELRSVLPAMVKPAEALTTVARWPRSLPQYLVGHRKQMAALEKKIAAMGGLGLLGNGYRGVGVPDLIRDARSAARELR